MTLLYLILSMFCSDAEKHNVRLDYYDINFVVRNIENDTMAVSWCDSTRCIIELDSATITQRSTGQMYTLIYHELGHIYLNRDDCDGKSIMNWDYLDINVRRKKKYMKELFSKSAN